MNEPHPKIHDACKKHVYVMPLKKGLFTYMFFISIIKFDIRLNWKQNSAPQAKIFEIFIKISQKMAKNGHCSN